MADDTTTAPTDAEVAQAQQVLADKAAADAAAAAARIKPITDFVASSAAQQIRASLETLQASFMNDAAYGVHINCALVGLKGLGVPAPAAATPEASSTTAS